MFLIFLLCTFSYFVCLFSILCILCFCIVCVLSLILYIALYYLYTSLPTSATGWKPNCSKEIHIIYISLRKDVVCDISISY